MKDGNRLERALAMYITYNFIFKVISFHLDI